MYLIATRSLDWVPLYNWISFLIAFVLEFCHKNDQLLASFSLWKCLAQIWHHDFVLPSSLYNPWLSKSGSRSALALVCLSLDRPIHLARNTPAIKSWNSLLYLYQAISCLVESCINTYTPCILLGSNPVLLTRKTLGMTSISSGVSVFQ